MPLESSMNGSFSYFVAIIVGFFPGQGLLAQKAVPAERAAVSESHAVAQTNSMDVLDNNRTLRVGDRLSYRVVEDGKPPVALSVTDSGEMEVPLIGRMQARGKSCKTLAFEIKKSLEKDYFISCTVILGLDSVGTRSRGRIFLMGPVLTKGPMELPPDEPLTVSRAILQAGGFAEFANRRKVKVIRSGAPASRAPNSVPRPPAPNTAQTFIIDVQEIIEKGATEKDMVLQPDDLVIVGQRLINF